MHTYTVTHPSELELITNNIQTPSAWLFPVEGKVIGVQAFWIGDYDYWVWCP